MTAQELEYQAVTVRYRNHRGEVSWRRIVPISIWYGSTDWHKEPQWLLCCVDIEKNVNRDFAIANIMEWKAGA